jgi:hypothetical protein
MSSFTGVNGGMAGMYMGAEGPPFNYDEKNSDGAVGGNPAVSKYLYGPVIPAEPNERGWKDVIKAYPDEVMTYMVRFAPTYLPAMTPKLIARFGFDPSNGPGYVWHCHIIEHEDNDMMRPLNVLPNPSRGFFPPPPATTADNSAVDGFALEQNSPNPFTNSTRISFTVPYDSHVSIKLFNLSGAEVKTLVDADLVTGSQSIVLNSANLPKGTYLYQMKSGVFISTKTLIIN